MATRSGSRGTPPPSQRFFAVIGFQVVDRDRNQVFIFAHRFVQGRRDSLKIPNSDVPGKYVYIAGGDLPLPASVCQSQATAHGAANRQSARAAARSGLSDTLRIAKSIADAEVEMRGPSAGGGQLVGVNQENRIITMEEVNKMAQQLNSQQVTVSELVNTSRMELYSRLDMASRFSQQSMDNQLRLVGHVINQLAVIQKDQSSAMVHVGALHAQERATHDARERDERMRLAALHASTQQAIEGSRGAQAGALHNLLSQSIDRAADASAQRERTSREQSAAQTDALTNVVSTLARVKPEPTASAERPDTSSRALVSAHAPRPARFAGGTGQRLLGEGGASRPREVRLPDSPRTASYLAGQREHTRSPPLERVAGVAAPSGGMGLALVAGAAVVAFAVANS